MSEINTKKKGTYEFFFYKEKGKSIGVCLTLDIVEEGKNLKQVFNNLIEAVRGHIFTVIKKNLSDKLLNRPAPKYYWERLEEFIKLKEEQNKRIPEPVRLPPPSFYNMAHFDVPLELLSNYNFNASWFK